MDSYAVSIGEERRCPSNTDAAEISGLCAAHVDGIGPCERRLAQPTRRNMPPTRRRRPSLPVTVVIYIGRNRPVPASIVTRLFIWTVRVQAPPKGF